MNEGNIFSFLPLRIKIFPPIIAEMKPARAQTCDLASSSQHPGVRFCQHVCLRNVRYAGPKLALDGACGQRLMFPRQQNWSAVGHKLRNSSMIKTLPSKVVFGALRLKAWLFFWSCSLLCNLHVCAAQPWWWRKRRDSHQTRRYPLTLIHS